MLTSADIHNKEFKRGFRGYAEDEVDDFLDEVVSDYEEMTRQIDRLKEDLSLATKNQFQYQQMEKNLQDTLVVAQKTADEVIQNARQRAAEIIKNAEAECETLRRQSEAASQKRLEEITAQVRNQQLRYDNGIQRERQFLIKIKSLLRTELELLDEDGVKNAVGELELELPAGERETQTRIYDDTDEPTRQMPAIRREPDETGTYLSAEQHQSEESDKDDSDEA